MNIIASQLTDLPPVVLVFFMVAFMYWYCVEAFTSKHYPHTVATPRFYDALVVVGFLIVEGLAIWACLLMS